MLYWAPDFSGRVVKECYSCKETKQLTEFNKDACKHDGLNHICRVCAKKKHSDWHNANPEKGRARSKKWRLANPEKKAQEVRKRRAMRAAVNENYTSQDAKYTRKLFNYKCFNCGGKEKLHIDHHRPLSRGNALTRTNAVLLCQPCNSSKHSKRPEDFYTASKLKKLSRILRPNKNK